MNESYITTIIAAIIKFFLATLFFWIAWNNVIAALTGFIEIGFWQSALIILSLCFISSIWTKNND